MISMTFKETSFRKEKGEMRKKGGKEKWGENLYFGSWTWNLVPGIWDLGLGTWNLERERTIKNPCSPFHRSCG